ncbi:HGGxSTG domain-containing protein [Bradyrhizobium sp.]|uniref:HGGxSTG domain-containing protein n=1 Tax=Bradyrhizobium sp. TaxID=376 RepID=UPI003458E266
MSTSMKAAKSIVGNVEGVGYEENRRINPMHLHMHRAKRCGAKTRSGKPCQSPGMANGRCRMHGGASPGAPKGNRNAFKHGRYTKDAVARRKEIAGLIRAARALGALSADRWLAEPE